MERLIPPLRTLPWSRKAVFFGVLMSVDSIQVGQFPLLFTTFWIAYLLLSATRNRGLWMGLALALPGAIKIYPALMLMVPLSLKGRRGWREIGFFVLVLIFFCGIIPTLFNGPRVMELSRSFVREVVFNPAGGCRKTFSSDRSQIRVWNRFFCGICLRVCRHLV
ncbi:glycosyltransferase 87 family protein [Abditibacterium utsteinense]|nr:glycosyltransferase 87 family protein [Abditibacterium utsteinense]